MEVRVLPKDAFDRLDGIGGPLETLPEPLDPEQTIVIVAEDAGVIVGYWVLFDAVHAEPLWIDPDHRNRPQLAVLLLQTLLTELRAHGIQTVCGIIGDPEAAVMEPMARKVGMQPLPGRLWGGRVPPE